MHTMLQFQQNLVLVARIQQTLDLFLERKTPNIHTNAQHGRAAITGNVEHTCRVEEIIDRALRVDGVDCVRDATNVQRATSHRKSGTGSRHNR